MINIPLTQPYSEINFLNKEIKKAIAKVLSSGSYILSNECSLFEAEFSKYLNSEFVVGCNSGTDALFIALKAIGIKENDEVIIPSHSALATCAAVKMTGAKVIFADIEKDFYTINPKSVEDKISKNTKAVIAVHIYGQSCNMDALQKICRKHKINLIEDCAQSAGAEYRSKKLGTIGDIGCFSFFPTKNLGTVGDGGCIVTNNKKFFEFSKKFRQYGWDENRDSKFPGINSRLDEIQAAVLRVKLRKLDLFNSLRNKIAKNYIDLIDNPNLQLPIVRQESFHSFHLFVVLASNRDKLIGYLESNGVQAGLHYKKPIHETGGYSQDISLPVTLDIYKKNVSLPMYPFLKESQQNKLIKILNNFN